MTQCFATDIDELRTRLLADRVASYVRLKGGFPVPLAGASYWAVLTWAGYALPLQAWIAIATWGSGLIFPLALLLARVFRNDFMKDRTASGDVLFPAFAAMLLFWPMLAAAIWTAPPLAPLILAIGMSMHWPVVGWSYGRELLFTAHAVIRALVVFAIWTWIPASRFTLLPLSVCIAYLVTVAAILVDVHRLSSRSPR